MINLLKKHGRWCAIIMAVGVFIITHSLFAVQYPDIERVSVALDGTESNGGSTDIIMSPDGNMILFGSSATNLIPDTKPGYRFYVLNRQAHTLEALDLDTSLNPFWKLIFSDEGRYLVHSNPAATWLRDLQTGTDELISVNKDGGASPGNQVGMSGDGRYVAFYSAADDILADMNNCNSVFIRDRLTSTTTCVPLAPGQTTLHRMISSYQAVMSRDGSKLYFHGNENGCCWGDDLYLYEVASQNLTLLDVDLLGDTDFTGYDLLQTSRDGSVLLFMLVTIPNNFGSEDSLFQHRFVYYDLNSNTVNYWDARDYGLYENIPDPDRLYLVSPIVISEDGRYIAGTAGRLDSESGENGYRNFIYDRVTDTSMRILNTDGDSSWGELTLLYSGDDALTTLGVYSLETNLVTGDTNGAPDVFLAFADPDSFPPMTPTATNTPTATHTAVPPATATATSTATSTPEGTPHPPVELLVNGDMDDNADAIVKLPDGWGEIGSLKKDRVRANNDPFTYAYSAPNAFQLTGTKAEVGIPGKLVQKVNLAGHTLRKGDPLTFSAMIDQRSGIPGTPIARAVVFYKNNTKQVYTLTLAKPKVAGYAMLSRSKPLERGGVRSIKVELFYAKAKGKFYIDDVSLMHSSASAVEMGFLR